MNDETTKNPPVWRWRPLTELKDFVTESRAFNHPIYLLRNDGVTEAVVFFPRPELSAGYKLFDMDRTREISLETFFAWHLITPDSDE